MIRSAGISIKRGEKTNLPFSLTEFAGIDSDRDRAIDGDEINTYGTDPNNADTDDDGIYDGDEVVFWSTNWIDDLDGEILENMELGIDAGCIGGLYEINFKYNKMTYKIKRKINNAKSGS